MLYEILSISLTTSFALWKTEHKKWINKFFLKKKKDKKNYLQLSIDFFFQLCNLRYDVQYAGINRRILF